VRTRLQLASVFKRSSLKHTAMCLVFFPIASFEWGDLSNRAGFVAKRTTRSCTPFSGFPDTYSKAVSEHDVQLHYSHFRIAASRETTFL
jgi:hypothetical protein